MKTKITLLILILLIIPLVYANNINIEIFKDTFTAGDTVPLKLTFTEKPLSPTYALNLIDNRSQKIKIGIIDIKVSDKEHYIYFDLPKSLQKGVYKIKVNGVLFIKEGKLVEETKEEIIEVNNITAVTFNPGIISIHIQNQPPVSMTLANSGYNNLTINFEQNNAVTLSQSSFSLTPKSSVNIQITINSDLIQKENKLEFKANNKSYIIPIIKTSLNATSSVASPIKFVNDKGIAIDEDFIATFSINTIETKDGVINFRNFGDIDLTEIKIELTGDLSNIIKLSLTELDKIEINKTKAIPITINEKGIPTQSSYSGSLVITTNEGYSIALPTEITIKDYVATITSLEPSTPKTERNRTISTTEEEKSSLAFWIIFIILVLGIAGFMIYRKVRKKKKLPKVEKPSFLTPKKVTEKYKAEIKKAEKEYKGL